MGNFTHLHVHTEYSLLDGLSKIKKLVARAKEYDQTALAITDHAGMYGAIEFYKEALSKGIKPIIGCEFYQAEASRFDKKRQDAFHLLLLALDNQGYENLMKIVTVGQTEGFYYKPRIDKEVLLKYHQGIAVTTACPAGRVQRLLLSNGYDAAKKELQELEQIFGSDKTFIELQRHPYALFAAAKGLPESVKNELLTHHEECQTAEKGLIKLSRDLGLPLIATNDTHYVDRDDAPAQDAIVCIQTGKQIADVNRLRYIDSPDFYLKSTDEMAADFKDLPEAIKNTALVADRVDIKITLGQWFFPKFALPEGLTPAAALRELSYEGAYHFFGQKLDEVVAKRLDYELEVIEKKGYSPYFLLYSKIVTYTNEVGIYTNTRGSAAGSLVSYCCGITTVDPIRFNLPFERFLNPFRPSPPDIDLDVSDDRRDDLIAWLKNTNGDDRVAQICTFGTMKARAAIRDVGRVLGMPYSNVDRISKMVPEGSQGFPMTLKKALEQASDLKKLMEEDKEVKTLIELAQKIENNKRHISVHAAGVVIAPDVLTKFTPLQLEPGGGNKVITQYEMHACEDVGLIKLDILGIRNLSILANAIVMVKQLRGVDIKIKEVPLDDKKTFEILAAGETFGVFQLSGEAMTKYLVELKPERIDDLMAMVALYRPGPIAFIPEYIARKHNPKLVKYFDPRQEKFLASSYGILTYQDDVLYTAIELAGYNWEEVDKLRKAIGKKIPEEMEKQHAKFVDGCVAGGMKREKAEDLWKQIETFAAYGFNKAHSASYGIVAYWTAYVKANYPVEYMTSLLTAQAGDTDKLTEAISECAALGIRILPPDINESLTGFTIVGLDKTRWLKKGRAREEGKAVRFGLSAIKNVGLAAITAILKARDDGLFLSLSDFLHRVDLQKANKKVLESLIGAGALDRYGKRAALLAAYPDIRNKAAGKAKEKSSGQGGLFDGMAKEERGSETRTDNLPDIPEMPLPELLKAEKTLLGFYLTDHPVKNAVKAVARRVTHKVSQLDPTFHVGQMVTLAGVLASVREISTKKNNSKMCFASLEDETATIDCVVFPKLFADTTDLWVVEKPLLVTGRIDKRDERISLIVEKAEAIDANAPIPEGDAYEIDIPRGVAKEILVEINSLLKQTPGHDHVTIVIPNGGEPKRILLPFTVKYTPALVNKVNRLLA